MTLERITWDDGRFTTSDGQEVDAKIVSPLYHRYITENVGQEEDIEDYLLAEAQYYVEEYMHDDANAFEGESVFFEGGSINLIRLYKI